MRAQYEFAVGLGLTIEGDSATVRQFNSEYGAASALSPIDAGVEVDFTGATSDASAATKVGGYKTMRWRTTLSGPADAVLRAGIKISGRPLGFARTLVQGYFIEPLLSVAAARGGSVLLPGAAFRDGAGAIVVLGRSGSGKTSLSMHALALGGAVFGDDQVIIDSAGSCRSFVRQLRLYPDLRERVPLAYARLPRGARVQLGVRRFVRAISRGAIAPPIAVPVSIFGQGSQPDPAPIARVVILERAFVPGVLLTEPATVSEAVSYALRLLREQREHLVAAGGDAWREAQVDAERQEQKLLEAAFRGASIRRIVVPSPLVGDAIGYVAEAAGLFAQPVRG